MKQHKARLVAQGFLQKHGVDYDETFCPVIRFESVRTVIALAAKNDLKLHQLDITTAFLNGELNEDIYMKQPEGLEVKGKEHLVCKLNRSLYGLKQSPRCWNETLNSQLKKMHFKQLENDPCIYTLTSGEEIFIGLFTLYVKLTNNGRSLWIVDSGAMCYTYHDVNKFINFTKLDIAENISVGNGHSVETLGRGTVELNVSVSVIDNESNNRLELAINWRSLSQISLKKVYSTQNWSRW